MDRYDFRLRRVDVVRATMASCDHRQRSIGADGPGCRATFWRGSARCSRCLVCSLCRLLCCRLSRRARRHRSRANSPSQDWSAGTATRRSWSTMARSSPRTTPGRRSTRWRPGSPSACSRTPTTPRKPTPPGAAINEYLESGGRPSGNREQLPEAQKARGTPQHLHRDRSQPRRADSRGWRGSQAVPVQAR
jgi:hypothetical protein